MKTIFFKIILFSFGAVPCLQCLSQQNEYVAENTRRINEFITGPSISRHCEGDLIWPKKYKRSAIRADRSIVSFINSVSVNSGTENDIDRHLKKLSKKRFSIEQSSNGLIKSKDVRINGKYLKANLRMELINSQIVRSKIVLSSSIHPTCPGYSIWMVDYKLLKDFFLKDINRLFLIGYEQMTSDTIFLSNLNSLATKFPDYKFNIPSLEIVNSMNNLFVSQYQTDSFYLYSKTKPPEDFVELIKENKISIIKDLLYSPNYFVSINAMEALIYLSSVSKIQLSPDLIEKINQLKNATFGIMTQSTPDVFVSRQGYKDLRIKDEDVIKKYTSSL